MNCLPNIAWPSTDNISSKSKRLVSRQPFRLQIKMLKLILITFSWWIKSEIAWQINSNRPRKSSNSWKNSWASISDTNNLTSPAKSLGPWTPFSYATRFSDGKMIKKRCINWFNRRTADWSCTTMHLWFKRS